MSGKDRISTATALLFVIALSVRSQNIPIPSASISDSLVFDHTLGISFVRAGQEIKRTDGGYGITLESTGGMIRRAAAGIFVASRRTIDLPGSYGGKMYLDNPRAGAILKNIVRVDTTSVNGIPFTREYWAVYAGMGMWEGVVNCSALRNGQYYVVSLTTDFMLGKPGDDVEGKRITTEALRSRMADILSDPREPVVQQFNSILSSFEVGQ